MGHSTLYRNFSSKPQTCPEKKKWFAKEIKWFCTKAKQDLLWFLLTSFHGFSYVYCFMDNAWSLKWFLSGVKRIMMKPQLWNHQKRPLFVHVQCTGTYSPCHSHGRNVAQHNVLDLPVKQQKHFSWTVIHIQSK